MGREQSAGTYLSIKFLFVDKKETEASRAFLLAQSENLKPVERTMKIHAVFSTKVNQLWSRKIFCYCSNCFGTSFKPLSDGLKEHSLFKDVAALPNIFPHSQLGSDGQGTKKPTSQR